MKKNVHSGRRLCVCGLCGALALLIAGCGSKTDANAGTSAGSTSTSSTSAASTQPAAAQPASNADMKQSFSQKTFDINSVPPEQRERVRGMMQQNAPSAPSSPAPGK